MANHDEDGKGGKLPRGTYSKIARRLKVSPQHVRGVALGKNTSKRVSRALARVRASMQGASLAS